MLRYWQKIGGALPNIHLGLQCLELRACEPFHNTLFVL